MATPQADNWLAGSDAFKAEFGDIRTCNLRIGDLYNRHRPFNLVFDMEHARELERGERAGRHVSSVNTDGHSASMSNQIHQIWLDLAATVAFAAAREALGRLTRLGGSRWILVDPGGSRWIPVNPGGTSMVLAVAEALKYDFWESRSLKYDFSQGSGGDSRAAVKSERLKLAQKSYLIAAGSRTRTVDSMADSAADSSAARREVVTAGQTPRERLKTAWASVKRAAKF
ncbi:hypothetical protein T492DRAFT_844466 [Pavlovales sp. CCMP2436]|nr:hypothetical protein T492DRAFT_844466 [Pavlovales sp. CCMP2436]